MKALRELIKFKGRQGAVAVAKELGDAMGRPVDPSAIRQLKRGKVPASAYVGPICRLYGWPVPPLAEVETDLGLDFGALYELRTIDPAGAESFHEAIQDRLKSARKIAELRRATPEDPKKTPT